MSIYEIFDRRKKILMMKKILMISQKRKKNFSEQNFLEALLFFKLFKTKKKKFLI